MLSNSNPIFKPHTFDNPNNNPHCDTLTHTYPESLSHPVYQPNNNPHSDALSQSNTYTFAHSNLFKNGVYHIYGNTNTHKNCYADSIWNTLSDGHILFGIIPLSNTNSKSEPYWNTDSISLWNTYTNAVPFAIWNTKWHAHPHTIPI